MTNTPGKPLAGKVALVTGGSRGIGAAIVRRLARDGARVVFTYAASADAASALRDELAAQGLQAEPVRADSAQVDAVRAVVRETAERHGRLDVLVNSAGILVLEHVDTYPVESFDRMVHVNVRAPFVAAQEAARHMGPGGRIVVIGSVTAERSGFPGTSVYSMTKAAVAGMVRGLAVDLGGRGITVNAVQPGPTITDMTDGEHREMLARMLPVGRLGQGDEIAGMVAYLAGEEAGFVTGSCLTIDGGYLA